MTREALRDRVAMYAARMSPEHWERVKQSDLVGFKYGIVPNAFEVADSMMAAGLIRDPEPDVEGSDRG